MTSKKLFIKTMLHDLKKRGWCLAIVFLIWFFALPVRLLLSLQGTSLSQLRSEFSVRLLYEYETFGFGERPLLMVLLAVGAIMMAMSGFSYLNSKKKVDFTHSMPIRRGNLFFSKYTAGVLLYMIPLVLNVGICLIIAAVYRHFMAVILQSALCYLLYQLIYFLFFYGTAVLAVVLVGNFVVSFLGIFILYFYQCVMWVLMVLFKNMFFPSYMLQYEQFKAADPVGLFLRQASGFCTIGWEYDYAGKPIASTVQNYYSKGWNILLLALAAAIIVTAASFLLFRLRSSESAGKTLAFSKAEPVVKVLLLLPSGLIGGLILRMIAPDFKTAWYIFGALIFFLLAAVAIEMIFRQDFKGFFKHKLSALAGFFCVLVVSLIFHLDLIGFESRIPEAQEVESVGISIPQLEIEEYSAYSYGSDNADVYGSDSADAGASKSDIDSLMAYLPVFFPDLYSQYEYSRVNNPIMHQCRIKGEEEIEKVRRLSEFYVKNKDDYQAYLKRIKSISTLIVEDEEGIRYLTREPEQQWFDVYCVYRLKNGKKIYRAYKLPYKEGFSEVMEPVYANEAYKLAANPILKSEDNYTYVILQQMFFMSQLRIGVSNQKELLEAYKKDILAQSFEDKWRKNAVGNFMLMNSMGGNMTAYYNIYSDFTNTKAFFEEHGCSLEKLNTEEEVAVDYLSVEHISKEGYCEEAEFTEQKDRQEILKNLLRQEFMSLEQSYSGGSYDYTVRLQYSLATDDPFVIMENSGFGNSYSSEGYYILKTVPECVRDAFD